MRGREGSPISGARWRGPARPCEGVRRAGTGSGGPGSGGSGGGGRPRAAGGPAGARRGAPAPLKGPLMFANPGLSGGPAGLLAQQQASERRAGCGGPRGPRPAPAPTSGPAWTGRGTRRRCRGRRTAGRAGAGRPWMLGGSPGGGGGRTEGTRRAPGGRRFPGPGGALGLPSQTGRAPPERDPSAAPGPAPSASLGI